MAEENVRKAIQFVIAQALQRGYQLSPEAILLLSKINATEGIDSKLDSIVARLIEDKERVFVSGVVETQRVISREDLRSAFGELFSESTENEDAGDEPDYEVVWRPIVSGSDRNGALFSSFFHSRYTRLRKVMEQRPEARQIDTIEKVLRCEKTKYKFRICGLISDKRSTKNGTQITLDDPTGRATIYYPAEKAGTTRSNVLPDQFVMITGEKTEGSLVVNKITEPDVPIRVPRVSKKLAYAILLSDLHLGSNKFLEGAFIRFLNWLKLTDRTLEEDREILEHLRYIVVAGDIVDGVGVFPGQEKELVELDVRSQYRMASHLIKQIPSELTVIIVPGNHDATRQALPQPRIPEDYAADLYGLGNVRMECDPCVLKLNGVKMLVFHGRSLDDVLALTPGLSYQRPTEAMRTLLRVRHLAPVFGARTPVAAQPEDELVIEDLPDVFHAGHVHTVGAESYRGTLIVNSGAWQGQTTYQSNLGILPSPGVVPIVNLASLGVVFRQFLTSAL